MNKTCTAIFILLSASLSTMAQTAIGADFLDVISSRSTGKTETASAGKRGSVCPIDKSNVAKTVLSQYGAVFVASEKVTAPPTCRFLSEADVSSFQSKLGTGFVVMSGLQMSFQKAAADSLNAVVAEALAQGIRLRPLDGKIAGGRSYSDTVRLWNSRFQPALRYWVGRRKIAMDEAAAVVQMPLDEQIEKVVEWEAQGMKFGTNRHGSIFASVAPPGTSQHISLIAVDIAPPVTPALTALMNSHGWFQTVKSDKPHFTYLGLGEKDLPGRGLKALIFEGTLYWVPNMLSDNTTVNP